MTSTYIPLNDISLYVETYGEGAPLLMIHGGMSDHTMWKQHLPLLSQHFRVIAPDSRAHGRTKNSDATLSYRLMADDMVALIHALDLHQPLVCGYSDGGQVALEMAVNHPDLAGAYVFGGAAIEWAPEYYNFVGEMGIQENGEIDFEALERTHPRMIQRLRATQAPQGEDGWKKYLTEVTKLWLPALTFTAQDIAKITVPSLVLIGDRDEGILPLEKAVQFYRMLPNAELAIVPGGDHLFLWSKPELFAKIILDFLLRHRTTSQPTNEANTGANGT